MTTISHGGVDVKVTASTILIGMRFGRWTVIGQRTGAHPHYYYACQCTCGVERAVNASNLVTGLTTSCGCWKNEKTAERNFRHGQSHELLYRVWKSMRERCMNPHSNAYANYGERGITVCHAWHTWDTFRAWAIAHGYRPGEQLSVERVDVNGHYCPENCTIIPLRAQSLNTRRSRYISAFGETKVISEWSRDPRCVVTASTLRHRVIVCGWDAELAMSKPTKGVRHE
jgi:hypothetical protein